MAYETGTASDIRDLLDKLRLFAVNSAGWTLLKHVVPNVDSVTLDAGMSFSATASYSGEPLSIFGVERRAIRLAASGTVDFSGVASGKWLRWDLSAPQGFDTFVISPFDSPSRMPTKLKIQGSTDGSTWVDVVDSTSVALVWTANTPKSFSTSATTAYAYWRLVFTESSSANFRPAFIAGYLANELKLAGQGEIYLKGLGESGLDEIYVNFRAWRSPFYSEYLLTPFGASGFDTNLSIFNQAGTIPLTSSEPFMTLWDQPIGYWFSGDGRVLVGAAKITTVYQNFMAGFIYPYSFPDQYPYPLYISASYAPYSSGRPWLYSNVSIYNAGMSKPCAFTSSSIVEGNAWLKAPGGSWTYVDNDTLTGEDADAMFLTGCYMSPTKFSQAQVGKTTDGKYVTEALMIVNFRDTTAPLGRSIIGELPRVKWISGEGQSSENTCTIDGHPYIVFQLSQYTDRWAYFAMRAD